MLIEVKAKVKHVIDHKTRTRTETYILNKQFFSEAEYDVTAQLLRQRQEGTVEEYEILSLRLSSIKEVAEQYQGEYAFIADFRDIFVDDNGNEKKLKYKILLWADSLPLAYSYSQEIARQGYDMHIESLKESDIIYMQNNDEPVAE